MKKIEIISSVENGKLVRNHNRLLQAFKSFEGKVIVITVKRRSNTRSNNQNRYYWCVIVEIWKQIILDEWGEIWSKEETHEFLKYNCNYIEKVNESTGEIIRVSKSTTENSTTDSEMMHKQARDLAFEMFNVTIPLPNEQLNIEL